MTWALVLVNMSLELVENEFLQDILGVYIEHEFIPELAKVISKNII